MQDLTLLTDQKLVTLLRDGHRAALEEIYNRYWKRLLGIAINRLDNMQDAEECVQDVFFNLWKIRENFMLENSLLESYLSRSVRNQAFNVLDKRYRKRRREEGYAVEDEAGGLTPEQLLIFRELERQFDEAIQRLPSQCQLVFRLNHFDGLSTKEIAQRLDLSENTVKSHLKKARRDLKDDTEFLGVLVLASILIQF